MIGSDLLPAGHELWLDGGHNIHGAKALARTIAEFERSRPAPLVLIMGMMNTRDPGEFLEAFADFGPQVIALTIPGEQNAHPAAHIVGRARDVGLEAQPMRSLVSALRAAAKVPDARVLICGSLYLAGDVLARNGTPPN